MITSVEALKIIEDEILHLNINTLQPSELYDPIQYILTLKGKRIRPVMTLLSCGLFTDDIYKALPSALAIEIFHNFTLVHDDVMDNATLRRGNQTIHTKWNVNTAILSGDAMCIMAYKVLSESAVNLLPLLLKTFNETALLVCEGQQYDMNYETTPVISEDKYLEMIRLKTAVLLAASLKMGAIAAGVDDENCNLLYNFGINLGLAFQLQDDWLDTFGDKEILGKEIGKDIVANKKTYLLIKALELATDKQKQEIEYWISSTSFGIPQKIETITNIFKILNIDTLTQQKIQFYLTQATYHLQQVKVPENRKAELYNFANLLQNRRQ